MNEFQQAILAQIQSYGIVVALVFIFFSLFLRGFLWKYFKVRSSFGRLLMVKIRTPMRDYFEVGQIDEGFLVYKHKGTDDKKKATLRISVPKDVVYTYRCLGVTWIDIDEEKNAICQCNYNVVSGYDAKKFSDLNTRALNRPSVADNTQKIIMLVLVIIAILVIANLFLNYQNYTYLKKLPSVISSILTNIQGTVTEAAGI